MTWSDIKLQTDYFGRLFGLLPLAGTAFADFTIEAGNETQISPHGPATGEWIFYSKNVNTGRVVRGNMEALVYEVERLSGKKFLIETYENE